MSYLIASVIWLFHLAVVTFAMIGLREMAFHERGFIASEIQWWALYVALLLTLHYVH